MVTCLTYGDGVDRRGGGECDAGGGGLGGTKCLGEGRVQKCAESFIKSISYS